MSPSVPESQTGINKSSEISSGLDTVNEIQRILSIEDRDYDYYQLQFTILFNRIKHYNQNDCIIMYKILAFLREYHQTKKTEMTTFLVPGQS
jgi:hypothetical protein